MASKIDYDYIVENYNTRYYFVIDASGVADLTSLLMEIRSTLEKRMPGTTITDMQLIATESMLSATGGKRKAFTAILVQGGKYQHDLSGGKI